MLKTSANQRSKSESKGQFSNMPNKATHRLLINLIKNQNKLTINQSTKRTRLETMVEDPVVGIVVRIITHTKFAGMGDPLSVQCVMQKDTKQNIVQPNVLAMEPYQVI